MGGDHKCPLCEATFTRPQHVGRHLRAHTGDRPYECKECPLKFARRHVNKTHREPEAGSAPVKEGKKTRRKSLGMADGKPLLKSQEKSRSASFSLASQAPLRAMQAGPPPIPQTATAAPQLASPYSQLQALSTAYPLAGPSNYATRPPVIPSAIPIAPSYQQAMVPPSFVNPFAPDGNAALAGTVGLNTPMYPPVPRTTPGSGSGVEASSSTMARNASMGSGSLQSTVGSKDGSDHIRQTRACDQCKHSKVRCDAADPCIRCTTKKLICSYHSAKKKSPITINSYPPTQSASVPGSGYVPSSIASINTSVSPQSSFSSPYSNTSPMIPHLNPQAIAATALLQQQAYERRRSSGGPQSMAPPAPRNSLPLNPYQSPVNPSWQPLLPDFTSPYAPSSQMLQQQYLPSAQFDPGQYHPPRQGSWPQVPTGSQQYMASIPQGQPTPSLSMVHIDTSQPSPTALAPTPALTNYSTSPSGPSEPPEQRRMDSGGSISIDQLMPDARSTGAEISQGDLTSKGLFDIPSSTLSQPAIDPSMFQSQSFPGTSPNSLWMSPNSATSTIQASMPAPEAPIDQMYQFRTTLPLSFDEDDTTASQTDSGTGGAGPMFVDMDEAIYQQQLEHRRRASMTGGVWATAFNNMSLHDSAGNPLPNPLNPSSASINLAKGNGNGISTYNNGNPLPVASALFTSTHLQLDGDDRNASKITRPTMLGGGNGADSTGRLPSMSDVKDLWKMYMTDPMTGPTPSKEKTNFLDFAAAQQAVTTPRPGMGNRSLSKSNSMPDLKSPSLTGQTFFSNVGGRGGYDGVTPTAPVPSHSDVAMGGIREQGTAGNGNGNAHGNGNGNWNEAALKEWQKNMKDRQDLFAMAIQHPGPTGKRGSKNDGVPPTSDPPTSFPFQVPVQPTLAPSTSYPNYALLPTTYADMVNNRPVASVFQRNQGSMLNQTLGPERAPSFGIQGPLFDPLGIPSGGVMTPPTATFPRSMTQAQYIQQQQQQQQQPNLPLPIVPPFPTRSGVAPIPVSAHLAYPQAGGKVTSSSARPGSKRLASQTLVGAEGKKPSFSLFDAEEEGEEGHGDDDHAGEAYQSQIPGAIAGLGMAGMSAGVVPEWPVTHA